MQNQENEKNEFSIENLPSGPWDEDIKNYPCTKEHRQNNPNLYEFSFCGYKCSILRNELWFSWCGYIHLQTTHPYFHKNFDEISSEIKVHGDLSYGDGDGVFGFDCGHTFIDILPGVVLLHQEMPELAQSNVDSLFGEPKTYKDREFVVKELIHMAQQFKTIERNLSRRNSLLDSKIKTKHPIDPKFPALSKLLNLLEGFGLEESEQKTDSKDNEANNQ